MKLLLGGALLVGVGVGVYALMQNQSAPAPSPAPSPTPAPLPTGPIADTGIMCAQVVTKCNDGSWAPTPCDCKNRGGVAPISANAVVYPSDVAA